VNKKENAKRKMPKKPHIFYMRVKSSGNKKKKKKYHSRGKNEVMKTKKKSMEF
jgi:hypothetical protein